MNSLREATSQIDAESDAVPLGMAVYETAEQVVREKVQK